MVAIKQREIEAADLFCGAGGTSHGLYKAADDLNLTVNLLAVNHWCVAIKSHTYNHKLANHLCESLDNVNPRKVVPSGHLDLLVASPECTNHSNAKGGKPKAEQSRASAWHVLRWGEALKIDNIVVENVVEFMDWGPLDDEGFPIPERKGETFNAWVAAIRSLGYDVEYNTLNAADYGDPTARRRFILMARRGGGKVTWPEKTHGPGQAAPYRTAREIIDWGHESKSIFTRKKPLAANTLRRIEAGLKKFGGAQAEPFLVMLRGGGCKGAGGADNPRCHSTEKPLPTVTGAHRGEMALVEPFIVNMKGKSNACDIDKPVPTQTTQPHLYLCEPFLTKYYGTGAAVPVDVPLDTVTTKERFGLVEPSAGPQGMDIHFRMLQPHELAASHSLDDMVFFGTKGDQVKQIGNSVPSEMARAICRASLN